MGTDSLSFENHTILYWEIVSKIRISSGSWQFPSHRLEYSSRSVLIERSFALSAFCTIRTNSSSSSLTSFGTLKYAQLKVLVIYISTRRLCKILSCTSAVASSFAVIVWSLLEEIFQNLLRVACYVFRY